MNDKKQDKPKRLDESRPQKQNERFREGNRELAYDTGQRAPITVQSVMPPPTKPGKR